MAGKEIGFVGIGRMGGPMARRLIEAGYRLTVSDTSAEATATLAALGASVVGSPKAVAAQTEIVLTSLPTPAIVQEVALGARGVAAGGKCRVFVDMSTTGATMAARVAKGLADNGITSVDAPVSGGVVGAERGTLAVMVSCPDETFDVVQPVLSHLGKLFHVGDKPGQGQTMKLLNNLLSATVMAASAEAVVMGVKAGLDPRMIVDVINAGSGRNSATQDKIPRCVLNRKFDFGFALGLLNKDVRLCLEEADALSVPMMVGGTVRQLLAIATASQGAQADMTEIMKTVERWGGVTVGRADGPG